MGGVWFFVVFGFQDVAANCIFEIPSLPVAQDWFNLKTLHKLSSYENISDRKIFAESAFEPGAAGWEALMQPLCYAAPQDWSYMIFFIQARVS